MILRKTEQILLLFWQLDLDATKSKNTASLAHLSLHFQLVFKLHNERILFHGSVLLGHSQNITHCFAQNDVILLRNGAELGLESEVRENQQRVVWTNCLLISVDLPLFIDDQKENVKRRRRRFKRKGVGAWRDPSNDKALSTHQERKILDCAPQI